MNGMRHSACSAVARPGAAPRRRGFTLVELILVMALLAAVLAVVAPRLGGFFEGRRLREESRRLLALTRFARSEAIARGTPMDLWLDAEAGRYGLRSRYSTGDTAARDGATGQSDDGTVAREYELGRDLALELRENGGAARHDRSINATIGFQPDGSIDDDSPELIALLDGASNELLIERALVGIGYSVAEEVSRAY